MKVGVYAGGKPTDIAVKPNEKTLAYDGTVTAPTSATFILPVRGFRKSGRRPPKD